MRAGGMSVGRMRARSAGMRCRSISLSVGSVGCRLVIGVGGIGCEDLEGNDWGMSLWFGEVDWHYLMEGDVRGQGIY